MKNKVITLIIVNFLFGIYLNAAKFTQVVILDPGDIYSTYTLESGDITLIKNAINGDDKLFSKINESYTENGWPSPLSEFNWRINNSSVIKNFKAYLVCNITNGKSVLYIPYKQNKSVKAVKLTKDVYIIIKSIAIDVKSKKKK